MKIQDVEWNKSVPVEVVKIIRPLLKKWLVILPTWCQDFSVSYNGGDDDLLTVTNNFRNRWAVVTVTGKWIASTEEDREVSLIHELIHVNLEPMSSASLRIIEEMTEKGSPLQSLSTTMVTDGLEGSTEDLARAFYRLQAQP